MYWYTRLTSPRVRYLSCVLGRRIRITATESEKNWPPSCIQSLREFRVNFFVIQLGSIHFRIAPINLNIYMIRINMTKAETLVP